MKLSLKEALARRDEEPAASPAPSGTLGTFALQALRAIDRPVDLVRLLRALGCSLKKAYAALQRITSGERVCLELWTDDARDAESRFKALGVAATPVSRPWISVADVRRRLDLTQAEFAMRFGFELDTVRNWEQGRNSPDPAIHVLLAVIQQAPDIVDRVMTSDNLGRVSELSPDSSP